ncbi:MAG TPA: hypothetical protein VNJ08_13305 [Bacteriovoracaceae bacterium]|nr:hypothetical protein [Bacteriovoracaceae bacterium]
METLEDKKNTGNSGSFGTDIYDKKDLKEAPQYYGVGGARFSTGTSDTLKLIKTAHDVLDEIYRPGFGYKKDGVLLIHIVPASENQLNRFSEHIVDNKSLGIFLDS